MLAYDDDHTPIDGNHRRDVLYMGFGDDHVPHDNLYDVVEMAQDPHGRSVTGLLRF